MKLRYALVYYFPIIDLEIAKLCTAVCSILFNSAGRTKDLCKRNKCCGFSEQGIMYTGHCIHVTMELRSDAREQLLLLVLTNSSRSIL